MCDSTWNLNEFRALFEAKYGFELLPRIEAYINTLKWKIDRSEYHANKVDEYWNSLMSRSVVSSNQPYFAEAMYFSAFEMESMIQALHSYGDILSQIVNAAFSGSSLLDEGMVRLNGMIGRIPETITLGGALKSFSESPAYSYVSAFCNVIKHRKLIDVDFGSHMDFVNRQGLHGFRFKDFTYKGNTFKATFFDEIANNYRNDLFEKLKSVGIEINNQLR